MRKIFVSSIVANPTDFFITSAIGAKNLRTVPDPPTVVSSLLVCPFFFVHRIQIAVGNSRPLLPATSFLFSYLIFDVAALFIAKKSWFNSSNYSKWLSLRTLTDQTSKPQWQSWGTGESLKWIKGYETISIDHAVKQAMLAASISSRFSIVSDSSLIQYTKTTKDYMVPSVWGPVDKRDDPYAPASQGGCCVVMWESKL